MSIRSTELAQSQRIVAESEASLKIPDRAFPRVMDWSLACLGPAFWRAIGGAFLLTILLSAGIVLYVSQSFNPLTPVGDANWGSDYRDHTLTDFACPNEKACVLTSAGGGASLLRTDAGRIGIWKRYTRANTDGLLAEDDLFQVHYSLGELFFVGKNGTLSRASESLKNWSLLYGGGKFAPSMDFDAELSALVVGPQVGFLSVGTRSHGLGIYDTKTHSWIPLDAHNQMLPSNNVSALAWADSFLVAGTSAGLRAFDLENTKSGIKIERLSHFTDPFNGRSVQHLQWNPESKRLDVTLKGGAHFSGNKTLFSTYSWQEHVDEGDSRLRTLNGPAALNGLVVQPGGGALFGLPDYGPARYLMGSRRLNRDSEGLPSNLNLRMLSAAPGGGSVHALVSANEGGGARPGYSLYHLSDKNRWEPVTGATDLSEFAYAGQFPVGLRNDGTAHLFKDGQPDFVWFEAGPSSAFGGSAETVGKNVFVSGNDGNVHWYTGERRSWSSVSTATTSPVRQIRGGLNILGIVKENGEAGYLETMAAPRFKSIFGPSVLLPAGGPVVSAAKLSTSTWFLRGGGLYRYDSASRSIESSMAPANAASGFVGLRATQESLYGVSESGGNYAVHLYQNGSWEDVSSDIIELTTVPNGMVARQAMGSVLVAPDKKDRQTYFSGTGKASFKKLLPDGFGRLWGLDDSDQLWTYLKSNGSWRLDSSGVRDFVMTEPTTTNRKMFVGLGSGVKVLTVDRSVVTEDKSEKGPLLLFQGEPILQLALFRDRVWALTGVKAAADRSIRSSDVSGTDEVVWFSNAAKERPGTDAWRDVVWASFVDKELWIATSSGALWTYSLDSHGWKSIQTHSTIRNPQLSASGALWWLEAGTLFGADIRSGVTTQLQTATADLSWRLYALEGARVVGQYSLYLALLILGAAILFRAFRRTFPTRFPRSSLVLLAIWGVTLAVSPFLRARFITPLEVFEGRHFNGTVTEFSIRDNTLSVRTNDGVFALKTEGIVVSPMERTFSETLPKPNAPALADATGRWRLDGSAGNYQLVQSLGNSASVAMRMGEQGFLEDWVTGIAFDGDTLVATTAGGLADLQVSTRWLGGLLGASVMNIRSFLPTQPLELTGIRDLAPEVVAWSEGAAWIHSQSSWRPAQIPSRTASADGISWTRTASKDELDSKHFDARSGRFFVDQVNRVVRDAKDDVWLQTAAGWRRMNLANGSELTEILAGGPAVESNTRRWALSSTWNVTVMENVHPDAGDGVTFQFALSGLITSDPFTSEGRLPDETALTVAAVGNDLWYGTAFGLRSRKLDRQVLFPGEFIEALATKDQALYCRVRGVTYKLESGAWLPKSDADPFPTARGLSVNLGDHVQAKVSESFANGKWTSVLHDYSGGRFFHDQVQHLEGDASSLWVVTPAGLQFLSLDGRSSSAHFTYGVTAVRKDLAGGLWVLDAQENAFKQEGAKWLPVARQDKNNLFRFPLTGKLTNLLSWKRVFQNAGDAWTLYTTAGDLDFYDGKLALDYVESTALDKNRTVEITRAGIIDGEVVIPLPDNHADVVRVENHWKTRSGDASVAFDSASNQWVNDTPEGLEVPVVSFDGIRWKSGLAFARKPRITDALGISLLLSADGQFPFDFIHSVVANQAGLWIANGGGVTILSRQTMEAQRFLRLSRSGTDRLLLHWADTNRVWIDTGNSSDLFLADWKGERVDRASEQTRQDFLSSKRILWRAADGGQIVRVERGENEIRAFDSRNNRFDIPVSGVLAVLGLDRPRWLLTDKQLYEVRLGAIRQNQ